MRATVSGSFHRHMGEVYTAVHDLQAKGVEVLSPSDPRVVDAHGDFLFVASDKLRSIKLVQDRHFQAIKASDFLLVVSPDAYTGPSVCLEIGFAIACGVPVFSTGPHLRRVDHSRQLDDVTDVTVGRYIKFVQSLDEAIARAGIARREAPVASHVLLDPVATIDRSHALLDELGQVLTVQAGDGRGDAENKLSGVQAHLRSAFSRR